MPHPHPAQPDSTDHVVKRVLANGTLVTLAGVSASSGYSGEGLPARQSLIANPQAVASFGSAGSYLISCRATNRIMWLTNGVLTTVAGTGTAGLSGDGGPATSANINPSFGGVAADAAGSGGGFVFSDQGALRSYCCAWITPPDNHAPSISTLAQGITACAASAQTT